MVIPAGVTAPAAFDPADPCLRAVCWHRPTIADAGGFDPAELRRINFIQPDQFPFDTLTGEHKVAGNLLIRAEYRYDKADKNIFADEGGAVTDTQSRAVLGVVYSF